VRADAQRERARALEDLGQLTQAEQAYRAAAALRPDDWSVHNQLGAFLLASGRLLEARAAFARVTELAPDNVQGWNNLGSVAYAEDDFAEARRAWETSIGIAGSATAWSNLGTLAFFQGRYADAARAFEEAVKARENDHRLWANLAAARYWAPERRADARPAYEKVLELAERERRITPADGRLLARIATAHAFLDQPKEARAAMMEAVARAPGDGRVLFAAAVVFEHLGRRERALWYLRQALAAGYSRREVLAAPSLAALREDPQFKAIPPPS
jgi:Flp pilus assembly protein TadD